MKDYQIKPLPPTYRLIKEAEAELAAMEREIADPKSFDGALLSIQIDEVKAEICANLEADLRRIMEEAVGMPKGTLAAKLSTEPPKERRWEP